MERVDSRMPELRWAPQSPQGVLMAVLEELDRGGSLPKSYKDLERLGVPKDVLNALHELAEREGFVAARVVRVFIALLAERYGKDVKNAGPLQLINIAFDQGAHRILHQVLEPMTEWAVPEAA